MEVYEYEFKRVFERREYTQEKVEQFFAKMSLLEQRSAAASRSMNDSLLAQVTADQKTEEIKERCHCCQKWEIPERSIFSKIFSNESSSALYCHFCMKRVCSIECMSEEKFVIPRLFNVEYNLK